MTEKTNQEQASTVTELPKQKRSFDWKKVGKHVAFGASAVAAAVLIFKLASVPAEEEAPVRELDREPEAPAA